MATLLKFSVCTRHMNHGAAGGGRKGSEERRWLDWNASTKYPYMVINCPVQDAINALPNLVHTVRRLDVTWLFGVFSFLLLVLVGCMLGLHDDSPTLQLDLDQHSWEH